MELQKEGNHDRYSVQCTSRVLQILLEQRYNRIRCAKQNKPYIFYELYPSLISNKYPAGDFQHVDFLSLPEREGEPTRSISLSLQQQQALSDCKPSVAFMGECVGWGVKSGAVVPKNKLLFAYFGEFISTSEATKRHVVNEKNKAMNYILTIREHIPASENSHSGVLVSNIDASKFGNIARFVNHSCDPNACIVMLREQGAVVGVPVLKSLRTIAPGEQITFNYGGSEVKLPREDIPSGPTILGKRSAARAEDINENCPKFSEMQGRKRCYCGTAQCCIYLPFTNNYSK